MNLFSSDFLFQTPINISPWFVLVPVLFGLIFVGSIFAYWQRGRIAPGNPVLRRLVRRLSKAGMWTAGIGLFLAAMIYLQIDYIAMPIWMYLLVLGMIGTIGYFVYDLSERYPIAMHQLQASHVDRRYRPQARRRAEPQLQRPAGMKGKRRRASRR